MLRTRTVLPAIASKLILQVGGSVAATVIASAIFALVPRPDAAVPYPPAELTSGGKFAARVPGAEAPASGAYAGLPVLTRVATQPLEAEPAAEVAPVEGAKPAEPAVRTPKPRARPAGVAKAEPPRRPLEPVAALPAPAPQAGLSAGIEAARMDDGILPRVGAVAHSAWSFTTSTGGALLSRLAP